MTREINRAVGRMVAYREAARRMAKSPDDMDISIFNSGLGLTEPLQDAVFDGPLWCKQGVFVPSLTNADRVIALLFAAEMVRTGDL